MSDCAIQVESLGKEYRLGVVNHHTLARELQSWWAKVRGKEDPNSPLQISGQSSPLTPERFWALRDLSFEVKRGETLGIIGRNGAGKSTLLKILSQVTAPTTGQVRLKGRLASLLEVGTGFHPELTGRENVFLNGAILGMSRSEVGRKLDEIVAFAELAQFLDTPVKRYSSGMYVRLAFAVAAHLEPEILIVDEVLAVGDVQFQRKCLGKMEEVGRQGRTVLFVSHNMTAVQRLCRKAIWLEQGRVVQQGEVAQVLSSYLQNGSESACYKAWDDPAAAPGNERACLRSVKLVDDQGMDQVFFHLEQNVVIEVEYTVHRADTVLNLSLSLFNQEEVHVFASPSITDPAWFMKKHQVGSYRSRCLIPARLLNQGRYHLTLLLVENGRTITAQADRVVTLDMVDSGAGRGNFFGSWGGVVRPNLDWQTERL